MDIDSIVGLCTWEACKKCKNYNPGPCEEGCIFSEPIFLVEEGNVYCTDFSEL